MKYNSYEQNQTLISRNIPIEDISLNEKDFQNRQKPYSEESVEKIIQSVIH